MPFIFFVFCSVLLAVPAISVGQQQYVFKFHTYTTKDGLVHNYTKKCLQDSKGFLWIITQHGLSRFDGLNFKNFEHINTDTSSLPENDMEDIAIDDADNIWLSYRTGICFYSQSARRFIPVTDKAGPIKSNCIVFDKKRNCIWSVHYNSYTQIECNTLKVRTIQFAQQELDNGKIYPLLLDSKDRLWIPYSRSRYHCILLNTGRQYFHQQDIGATCFFEDEKKDIWAATWQTGFRKVFANNTSHQFTVFGDPFLKIAGGEYDFISQGIAQSTPLGGDSILWVIKNTDGLLLFNKKSGKFIQHFVHDGNDKNGLATNFNENIFCDRSGIIWICTWHGLTKVNKREQQFASKEFQELNNQLYNCVSGIQDDPYDKTVRWMSVLGSGIIQYNNITGEVIKRFFYYYNDKDFKGIDNNYDWRWVSTLITDSSKNIWAYTYGGLVKINKGSVQKIRITTPEGNLAYPHTLKQFSKGFIWLAAGKGLFKINTSDNSYIFYPDTTAKKGVEGWVGDMEKLDSGHLLVSGDKGVQLFTISSGKYTLLNTFVKNADSKEQQINRSIELIGNKLYIGSFAGLKVYDLADNSVKFIGKNEGIGRINHNCLYQDSHKNLWIYTAGGLFKYDTQKNRFEKFTTSDGIYALSEDAVQFFEWNKKFHIGYRMAITSFDPLQVNMNPVKVTPYITDVLIKEKILQEPVDSFQKHSLKLNYTNNEITFKYTAPDYTNTDKISFKYQLVGFDKEWVDAGASRSVTYNNLLPGAYTFILKAANSSGVWNDDPRVFKFYISTPLWQTWWFRLLCVAVACSLIYTVYRYRLKQLRQSYEIRSSISRNLHDEIGATLSSINIYSDVARNNTGEDETRQLAGKMYDASAKAMESMSDIVWYVNPQNDLLENMLVRMREYALPLLEARGINISFTADPKIEQLKLSMQQRQHLYLIFKEAVNNTLKYAAAKNVEMVIDRSGNEISMLIKDDGKGFDMATVAGGNGLKNMPYRATQLNGKLAIEAVLNKGTCISLQFPIT